MELFFQALGLMFVFEGILPFLMPKYWRHMLANMIVRSNRSIRVFGLISMLIGLIILFLSR